MVLFFSATGNSQYVAKRISDGIGDTAINLFEKIRTHNFSNIHSHRPWVVCLPTYAWRIPRIVENFIKNSTLTGSRQIYFVLTCGDSIGNAGKYANDLCESINMDFYGCAGIVMPENYIAMFRTPNKDESLKIIEKAEPVIDELITYINKDEKFPKLKSSILGKIYSSIVNCAFYPLIVHTKKFYVKDSCISCGKCTKVCPMSNITLVEGKPMWKNNCTHCMACICRCPVESIEYGNHSKDLPRYLCPKTSFCSSNG